MSIENVAVIGAGLMGSGLAVDLAAHGYQVTLKDIDKDQLDKAKEQIGQDLGMLRLTKPAFRGLDEGQLYERIRLATSYDGFDAVDFVIENITEDYEAKAAVYRQLREVCGASTYYGVNTSCISITKIGALMPDASRVIGMHFMNPVPMTKLVETIRGYHTSDETVETATGLVKSLEKTAVVVEDMPGFVTNRVLMLTINECAFLVQDGVAPPSSIDKIFRLGFSHKMGPLATGDLIGLDTILKSLEVLYESYNDPKYRPCPLLRKMVDAGLLGRKSGKGFFVYDRAKRGG